MKVHAVDFNEVNARQFVAIYNDAVRRGSNSFKFESHEYVTQFAYYLIQYLAMNNIVKGAFDERKIFRIAAVNPKLN